MYLEFKAGHITSPFIRYKIMIAVMMFCFTGNSLTCTTNVYKYGFNLAVIILYCIVLYRKALRICIFSACLSLYMYTCIKKYVRKFSYDTIKTQEKVVRGTFESSFNRLEHYRNVTTSTIVSQNITVSIVCSTVCSGADQRQHQSSASLAGDRWIPRTKGKLRGKCFHLITSSW